MIQIMDNDKKYHPNEKWHLKKGSKATYVEYWYPYDNKERKALTWEQYRDALQDGRSEKEFTLSTRYTGPGMALAIAWSGVPASCPGVRMNAGTLIPASFLNTQAAATAWTGSENEASGRTTISSPSRE